MNLSFLTPGAASLTLLAALGLGATAGCEAPAFDGTAPSSVARTVASGSYEERIVLQIVNSASFDELDVDANLDRRAAQNIVDHREGADGLDGTADDNLFDDVEELDAVSYVGVTALSDLADYAVSIYGEEPTGVTVFGIAEGSDEALAILELVNTAPQAELDDDVGLDSRAASNIVKDRSGADGIDGSADDRPFASLSLLDAVSYVGESAFAKLLAYVEATGMLVDADGDGFTADVDCNDSHSDVFPGAEEICDGIDNDCDPSTSEEGLITSSEGYTFDSINDAIDHTSTGKRLTVCPGAYSEHVSVDRAMTIESLEGPATTIIDGGDTGRAVTVTGNGVTLRGLTITGGLGSGVDGGGIYAHTSTASLQLVDLIVEGNAARYGGGIYISAGSTMTDVVIRDNRATVGGGVAFASGTTSSLSGVELSGNEATDTGGGMAVYGIVTLTDSELAGNTALTGAAVYMGGTTAKTTLVDSAVVANSDAHSGGGVFYLHTGTLKSTTSNWGKGADENVSADLYLATGSSYASLGASETFTCARTTTTSGSGACSF